MNEEIQSYLILDVSLRKSREYYKDCFYRDIYFLERDLNLSYLFFIQNNKDKTSLNIRSIALKLAEKEVDKIEY